MESAKCIRYIEGCPCIPKELSTTTSRSTILYPPAEDAFDEQK